MGTVCASTQSEPSNYLDARHIPYDPEDKRGGRLEGKKAQKFRSARLILIRHGQSEGNVNREVTMHTPDHQIHLTQKGREEALCAGRNLKALVGSESIRFFVSPYVRAQETANGIAQSFGGRQAVDVREDVLIREQDFGNFDKPEARELHKTKKRFGKFYYRFPEGESPADVYNRAGLFLESLYRRWSNSKHYTENTVIVSHELFIIVFLMRMFRYEVKDYYELEGLKNGEMIVLEHPEDSLNYDIAFTWPPNEEKRYGGLRRLPPEEVKMPTTEIWDGDPSRPAYQS